MRFIERLVIAAVLALAVVSGARTANPAEPGVIEQEVATPVAPR